MKQIILDNVSIGNYGELAIMFCYQIAGEKIGAHRVIITAADDVSAKLAAENAALVARGEQPITAADEAQIRAFAAITQSAKNKADYAAFIATQPAII